MSISCKDCLEPQVFADIYPTFFTGPVRENETKKDEDGTRRLHRRVVSSYDKTTTSTVSASTAASDTAATNRGPRRTIHTDTTRSRNVQGATADDATTRKLQDNAKSRSDATITIEDGTIFISAADSITLIEQTVVDMGFAPQQLFQGVLEVFVGSRNGMHIAQMSRTSLPDDP
jgi:hypothetical protein